MLVPPGGSGDARAAGGWRTDPVRRKTHPRRVRLRTRTPSLSDNRQMPAAKVKCWNDEEGWGLWVSPEFGEDIWAHFSAIDGAGYRELEAGQPVTCEVDDLGGPVQGGYRFRASRV